jgi:fido (protein-threonine AMPylation protein)
VNRGVVSTKVADELKRFESTLQTLVAELDKLVPVGRELDADQLAAVIDLCAWAHAEWVRIHPFANGNGRTARLWPTAWQCATVCHRLSVYSQDPVQVMETPELRR